MKLHQILLLSLLSSLAIFMCVPSAATRSMRGSGQHKPSGQHSPSPPEHRRHILSCALYNNWYPLLILVCYVLAPVPMCCLLAFRGGDSLLDSGGSKTAQHWAEFLSAVGVSVIVGLPFVL
tara:strand:- start:355 stop:717 length:363 start_codon:yes stop_codon:yes gene_type:complete